MTESAPVVYDPLAPASPAYEEWDYFAALPNLNLDGDRFFEAPEIAIVGPADARLQYPAGDDHFKAPAFIQQAFKTDRGDAFQPSALLLRKNPPPGVRTVDAIRAFRDGAAFVTILQTRSDVIADDVQGVPLYTDTFDFFPRVPHSDGGLTSLDGPVIAYEHPDELIFQPHPHLGNPSHTRIHFDRYLWDLITAAWRVRFVTGNRTRTFEKVFRSLNMAFHAMRFPADGVLSIYDFGTRIGLWVSAIETLLHPGGSKQVGRKRVLKAIGRIEWERPILRAMKYTLERKRGSGKPAIPANFAQRFYDRLYTARCDFLHGEPVTFNRLFFSKPHKSNRLDFGAPFIYGALLKRVIERGLSYGKVDLDSSTNRQDLSERIGSYMRQSVSRKTIEDGLLAAQSRRERWAGKRPHERKRVLQAVKE